MAVCECGREIEEKPETIVANGGWCEPPVDNNPYSLPEGPEVCGSCKARFLFISYLGFDPGVDGENIRPKRGRIKYSRGL